jgi:cytochrome c oxidase subunit I
MVVTEAPPGATAGPATSTAAEPSGLEGAAPSSGGGIAGLFGSGDHRVIGRLYIATSVVFLLLSGVLGGLLGIERLEPEKLGNVFSQDTFAQVFSLHGVSGLYLFMLPMLLGVAFVVVPRQVGAETIAFPRAAAASYWAYLLAGVMVVVSYLINGGPFGTNEHGLDLFVASLALVAAALILASVCVGTTVLALRAPGLRLDRAPAFAWSMLVASTIWIASLGVLVGLLVLLYLDSRYRVFRFSGAPGSDGLDHWLRWVVTPPQVFAAAIPVLGFVAEVGPVFGRSRPRRHGVVLGAVGAFGALSFGAWTFYGFKRLDPGSPFGAPRLTTELLYIAVAFAILLPTLAIVGGVGDALRRGRLRLASPLLFGLAAALMLLAGVAAGAVRAITPLDLVGTTADASVAHFTLGAAAIAAIGAVHYWWPQILGKPLREGLGLATAGLALLGTVVLAAPDLVNGFLDEPRGSVGVVRDGVKALNAVSLVGGVLLLVAAVLFIVNIAASLAADNADTEPGADGPGAVTVDPWDGHTLEWAADPSSVTIDSATPVLDARGGLS